MLKEILAITGKPGLFKIVSNGNRMLIVEDIKSKKRLPVGVREKVVSLGDIAMYTEGDDKPLSEILQNVYDLNEGKQVDLQALIASDSLRDEFAKAVPDFDRERVYVTDIKKLYQWYNLLVEAGLTDFNPKKEEEAAE